MLGPGTHAKQSASLNQFSGERVDYERAGPRRGPECQFNNWFSSACFRLRNFLISYDGGLLLKGTLSHPVNTLEAYTLSKGATDHIFDMLQVDETMNFAIVVQL